MVSSPGECGGTHHFRWWGTSGVELPFFLIRAFSMVFGFIKRISKTNTRGHRTLRNQTPSERANSTARARGGNGNGGFHHHNTAVCLAAQRKAGSTEPRSGSKQAREKEREREREREHPLELAARSAVVQGRDGPPQARRGRVAASKTHIIASNMSGRIIEGSGGDGSGFSHKVERSKVTRHAAGS